MEAKGDAPEAKDGERAPGAKRGIAFAEDGARAPAPAERKDEPEERDAAAAHDADAAEGLFTVHLTRAAGGHRGRAWGTGEGGSRGRRPRAVVLVARGAEPASPACRGFPRGRGRENLDRNSRV